VSFSGYYQILCKRGHEASVEIDSFHKNQPCQFCGQPIVWRNTVDLTNGSYDEDGKRIDDYKKLRMIAAEKRCKCPICSCVHLAEPARYEVPQ
jgi:hypothetical protein